MESDRYPSADRLAELYSPRTGTELADWNFYLALANFKLGVIGKGITYRACAAIALRFNSFCSAECPHR